MQKINQTVFDFNDSISEPFNDVRGPKNNKTKMLKDLNKACNMYSKSEKNVKAVMNSRDKDLMIAKQRSRINSSTNQMDSLLEKVIPGAKIRKGEWKDNKLHGQVIIEYDNGNIFEGKYQNNVRVEGKMIYKEANCEYEGYFFGQKFSGYGKLSYYGGRAIEGEWDSAGMVGNCTISYPNEDVYYGPVDEKLYKHGEGHLFFKNGYKYIGSFRKGSISGIGSYFKDQKLIVKGVWQKGQLVRELTENALIQETQFYEVLMDGQPLREQSHTSQLRPDMSRSALFQILKVQSAQKPSSNPQEFTQKQSKSSRIQEKSLSDSSG